MAWHATIKGHDVSVCITQFFVVWRQHKMLAQPIEVRSFANWSLSNTNTEKSCAYIQLYCFSR